ncbi:MAG: transglutaminase family protein [Deltaproteobacteria bacterium]|nr:transglutaminase family protein [Myxococcales bacterium]MDP3213386.1 transglutaminase family protein [Deltaproteobacteria bacterium]
MRKEIEDAGGRASEHVAGVRFRVWRPAHCLHPTIDVHHPVRFVAESPYREVRGVPRRRVELAASVGGEHRWPEPRW